VLLSIDENQWCFVEFQNSTLQGLFSISLITINALKLANLNRMCDFFGTTKAARTKLIDAHLSWHHRVRRQKIMTVLQVRHAWFCYKQWMKIVGAQQPHTHKIKIPSPFFSYLNLTKYCTPLPLGTVWGTCIDLIILMEIPTGHVILVIKDISISRSESNMYNYKSTHFKCTG